MSSGGAELQSVGGVFIETYLISIAADAAVIDRLICPALGANREAGPRGRVRKSEGAIERGRERGAFLVAVCLFVDLCGRRNSALSIRRRDDDIDRRKHR